MTEVEAFQFKPQLGFSKVLLQSLGSKGETADKKKEKNIELGEIGPAEKPSM